MLPFFVRHILSAAMRSRAVLVVAHENSLRALLTAFEDLTPDEISLIEFATGEMRRYAFDADAKVVRVEND